MGHEKIEGRLSLLEGWSGWRRQGVRQLRKNE